MYTLDLDNSASGQCPDMCTYRKDDVLYCFVVQQVNKYIQ